MFCGFPSEEIALMLIKNLVFLSNFFIQNPCFFRKNSICPPPFPPPSPLNGVSLQRVQLYWAFKSRPYNSRRWLGSLSCPQSTQSGVYCQARPPKSIPFYAPSLRGERTHPIHLVKSQENFINWSFCQSNTLKTSVGGELAFFFRFT